MIEIWKNLPGYEGLYLISNLGRVKNKKNKIKNCRVDRYGYLRTNVSKNSIKTYIKIHRTVALLFLENLYPNLKTEVDHIDGDKTNNTVTNLRWVTPNANKALYWMKYRKAKCG